MSKTKTVKVWVDLDPCWHTSNYTPFFSNTRNTYPKAPSQKRIEIDIELPIWGEEVDLNIGSESKEIEKGFKE